MAGRSPYAIDLTSKERAELEQRAACYTRPHKEVQRAKMILYAADDLTNREIAARLDTAPDVVGRWRKRFHEQRLGGLADRARAGRPRRFPPGRDRPGQGDRLRAAQRARPAALALLAR
jgi:winged helix-turn helix protein